MANKPSTNPQEVPAYRTGPNQPAGRARTKNVGYGTLNRRPESIQLAEIWIDWSVLAEVLRDNRDKVLVPRTHRATAQYPEKNYYALRLVAFRSDDPNNPYFFKVSLDLDPAQELARREQYRAQQTEAQSGPGGQKPAAGPAMTAEPDEDNWDPFSA
jgi:hypothetical protein